MFLESFFETVLYSVSFALKRVTPSFTHAVTASVNAYEKCLNRYVTPRWESKDIHNISQDDVRNLIFDELPEGVTPHTRKAILKLVRKILEMAVEAQEIAKNPCAGLAVRAPVNDQEVLNRVEVDKLLSEGKVTNHYFYPVWVTALMTGMRSGELNALLWSDVDFESKKIHVTKSWSGKNGIKPTKNERNRIVPISDAFLAFLRELRLKSNPNEPNVLPRIGEWQRGDQAKVLREFCRRIGITPVRFHDLRATFITNMLAQGVAISKVMAIVGHSQMNTTDGYNRRAGIGLEGTTNQLAYEIPTFDDSQVVPMSKFR
jgi:integrase